MNPELIGTLVLKENTVDISATFKKREFVIEVLNERNAQYNDFIKFQLTQDRCGLIDNFQVGQQIKVGFNIRGKKYEKNGVVNYFNSLEAWRIDAAGAGQAAVAPEIKLPTYNTADVPAASPEEDLPF